MKNLTFINAIASASSLGTHAQNIWKNYKTNNNLFSKKETIIVSRISEDNYAEIKALTKENNKYKSLDKTVLQAIYTSRQAIKKAGWKTSDNFGINIGSSRGATQIFETHHEHFLKNKKTKTLTSPNTTLGNISSWVAHDLQTQGPEVSHSITCSTALHALLNGIAWLNSGMCDKFLVGGSEAPLTKFTIAQMQALKIYASLDVSRTSTLNKQFPCRASDVEKNENTMILGEAASVICLENCKTKNTLAAISGVGYATEILKNNTAISANGDCFQKSMQMALDTAKLKTVDAIVTHTPGTVKGDLAEINAIKNVFGNNIPALTNNKWKIGHTLGASGMLSVEMAILMLQHQEFIPVPFVETTHPKQLQSIMVNAVGFGGNAVSVIIEKV